MERVDNLTCEGCLHLQIKNLTNRDPKHCAYCLRNTGETRTWQAGSRELLMYIMDCYINLTETSMPVLTTPPVDSRLREKPKKKEKASLS